MRIISRFKDYYDGVQKLGQDEDVVYLRKTIRLRNSCKYDLYDIKYPHEEIKLIEGLERFKQLKHILDFCNSIQVDSILKPNKHSYRLYSLPNNTYGDPPRLHHYIGNKKIYFSIHRGLVFFSGEIIPVLVVKKYNRGTHYQTSLVDSFYIYTSEQLDQLALNNDIEIIKEKYDLICCWLTDSKIDKTNFLLENKIISILIIIYNNYSRQHKGNINNVLDFIINPCLSDLQFQKKYDANTTFQKLDSYICGTLAYPQNELIEVSNEQKILKHGFDPIYGFRKRKQ